LLHSWSHPLYVQQQPGIAALPFPLPVMSGFQQVRLLRRSCRQRGILLPLDRVQAKGLFASDGRSGFYRVAAFIRSGWRDNGAALRR
jgi:hypothetical protein